MGTTIDKIVDAVHYEVDRVADTAETEGDLIHLFVTGKLPWSDTEPFCHRIIERWLWRKKAS